MAAGERFGGPAIGEEGETKVLDPAGVVVSDPDIAGGEPIFCGTRVTIATLFEHLEDGIGLGEFLEGFPTVDRRDVLTLLHEAHSLVVGQVLTARA